VFEIVPDAAEGYWWRLRTVAGRIVAASADAYTTKSTARAAAERVQSADDRLTFRVIADAGAYRWNIVAESGRIVGVSAEAFATSQDAERAARAARELIAGAGPPSDLSSTVVDRARRHVTARSDGRWQVQAEGSARAASTHATQADAVRSARQEASNLPGGAEVIVHGRDGRVRRSETVPTAG
jgi:uncharacterized protein YegP (UPF0339 family)